jgi:hypothetical protein
MNIILSFIGHKLTIFSSVIIHVRRYDKTKNETHISFVCFLTRNVCFRDYPH